MGDQVTPPKDADGEPEDDLGPGFNPLAMLQPWRPACVMCADNHRKAVIEIAGQLKAAGKDPASEEFGQLMEQAIALGEMVSRNPGMLDQLGDQVPPFVPAIRPADMFVNGNTLCMLCFSNNQPNARQSGLVAATPAGFMPGGLQPR
ncbi:MAG TPA: hypothetical protein VMU95_41125 [Trebonia sp.]|nr:hypothetical protein [Trebonia sp.]